MTRLAPPPRRAVVLAAGYGTRLAPLTYTTPKALMPLWGVPMLEHSLRLLRRWGVTDVLINGHAHAEQIFTFARTLSLPGLRINLSYEPDILGTGGPLHKAAWFVGEEPFWMLNADIAADLSPDALLRHPPRGKTLATLWVHRSRGPRTVDVARGQVTNFRSARPGAPDTATFCGLHLVSPRILPYIPDGFSSIITAYDRALEDGSLIRAVEAPHAYWADVGSPEQCIDAHRDVLRSHRNGQPGQALLLPDRTRSPTALRRQGVTVQGFAAVHPTARIAPGAVLEDAVVGPEVRIAARGHLAHAIAGPGTRIHRSLSRVAAPATNGLTPHQCAFIERAGWALPHTVVEHLPLRGSDRSFVRLHQPRRTAMLICASLDQRPENRLYAGHARLLSAAGVRVPEVLAEDPDRGLLIMEDVGTATLGSRIEGASSTTLTRRYRELFPLLTRLHYQAGARVKRRRRFALMPAFGRTLYRWERNLFRDQFLTRYPSLPEPGQRAALRDLARISRRLEQAEPVLIHRDLQSSNIHYRMGKPVLIDFQGMRFGPAAYDLASLLCDPYVALDPAVIDRLLAAYQDQSARTRRDMACFWDAAVQRLAQALGAYGRLSGLPGTAGFAAHIPAGLALMQQALLRLDRPAPALARLVDRLVSGTVDSPRGE